MPTPPTPESVVITERNKIPNVLRKILKMDVEEETNIWPIAPNNTSSSGEEIINVN